MAKQKSNATLSRICLLVAFVTSILLSTGNARAVVRTTEPATAKSSHQPSFHLTDIVTAGADCVDNCLLDAKTSFAAARETIASQIDQILNQCYLGVAGRRGIRFAQTIECVESVFQQRRNLFSSAEKEPTVAGSAVATPAGAEQPFRKNWTFPAENFVLHHGAPLTAHAQKQRRKQFRFLESMFSFQRHHSAWQLPPACRPLLKDVSRRSVALFENSSRVFQTSLAADFESTFGVIEHQNQWKSMIAYFQTPRESRTAPASVAKQKANGYDSYWTYYGDCEHWSVTFAKFKPVDVASTHHETPEAIKRSERETNERWFGRSSRQLSIARLPIDQLFNFVAAKLNWLSSNLRHVTEACRKRIEPQLLKLEFECVESAGFSPACSGENVLHSSVARRIERLDEPARAKTSDR